MSNQQYNSYENNMYDGYDGQQGHYTQQAAPRKQLHGSGPAPAPVYNKQTPGVGSGGQRMQTAADIVAEVSANAQKKMEANGAVQNADKIQKSLNKDDSGMQEIMRQQAIITAQARKSAEKLDLMRESSSEALTKVQAETDKNWNNNLTTASETIRKQVVYNENGFATNGITETVASEKDEQKPDETKTVETESVEQVVSVEPEMTEIDVEESDFTEQTIVAKKQPTKSTNWILKNYNGKNGSELSQAYGFNIPIDNDRSQEVMKHLLVKKNDVLNYIGDFVGIADEETKTQQLHIGHSENGLMVAYVAPESIYNNVHAENMGALLSQVKDVLNDSLSEIQPNIVCEDAKSMTYKEFAACETESATVEPEKLLVINAPKEKQSLMDIPDTPIKTNDGPSFG